MTDEATNPIVDEGWRSRVGQTLDRQEVTRLLGLTAQQLDAHARTGDILALPFSDTSIYPVWQFDTATNPPSVRPITLEIVTVFREALDEVSPYTVAAWATSPQPELSDRPPAEWIVSDGRSAPIAIAAQRAAQLEAT